MKENNHKEEKIHIGSLCFDIPFFIENTVKKNIFFEHFKKINDKKKEFPEDSSRWNEAHKKSEENIINRLLHKGFSKVKEKNFKPENFECTYTGRFLCDCFSLATKFHDDDNQRKETVQLWLDAIHVEYENPGKSFSMDFDVNIMFQLFEEAGEYNAHLILHIPIEDKTTIDEIILMKHLFYKESLKLNIAIDRKTGSKIKSESNTSLYEWFESYINEFYSAIDISKKNIPGKYFTYSLLEINNPGLLTEKDESIDRNNKLYALLTSDEGWRYFPDPEKFARKQLQQYYWSSRNFLECYFLGTNGLLINDRTENSGYSAYKDCQKLYFQKYNDKDERYLKFMNRLPCIAGLESQVFMNFQKEAEKRESIKNVMGKIEEYNEKLSSFVTMEMYKLEKLLKITQKAINSKAFSIQEMDNLTEKINRSFGISKDLEILNKSYSQKMQELSSRYEKRTKLYTFFITVIISLLGADKITSGKILELIKDLIGII
jgi:hypothetical protein